MDDIREHYPIPTVEYTDNVNGLLLDTVEASRYKLLRRIGRMAAQKGMRAAVVGGFVRDLLMGRHSNDIDISVEGDAVKFAQEVAHAYHAGYYATARFGTAAAVLHTVTIDFATARDERYRKPGALPEVELATIDLDLPRRDYTINSMAVLISPDEFGRLMEVPGARADLDAGIIRVNHDGSYEDDPTRILRGVRFEQRLGFTIEPHTEQLMRAALAVHALDTISVERIQNELRLATEEPDPAAFFRRMEVLGIWDSLHTGLHFTAEDADHLHAALHTLERMGKKAGDRWLICLMGLLRHFSADDVESFSRRFRFPRALYVEARHLHHLPEEWAQLTPGPLTLLLEKLRPESLALLAAQGHEKTIRHFWEHWRHVELEITAEDLFELGLKRKATTSRYLHILREKKIEGTLEGTEFEAARALLQRPGGTGKKRRRRRRKPTPGTDTPASDGQ